MVYGEWPGRVGGGRGCGRWLCVSGRYERLRCALIFSSWSHAFLLLLISFRSVVAAQPYNKANEFFLNERIHLHTHFLWWHPKKEDRQTDTKKEKKKNGGVRGSMVGWVGMCWLGLNGIVGAKMDRSGERERENYSFKFVCLQEYNHLDLRLPTIFLEGQNYLMFILGSSCGMMILSNVHVQY